MFIFKILSFSYTGLVTRESKYRANADVVIVRSNGGNNIRLFSWNNRIDI